MKLTLSRHQILALIAGYAIVFSVNGCYFTWSVLSVCFAEAVPDWTVNQLALTGALNIVCSGVSGFLAHSILNIFSLRNAVRLGGLIAGTGWFCMYLLTYCPSILLLYLGYSLSGFTAGYLYSYVGKVLTACCPQHSGTISGSMLFVIGFGGVTFGWIEQILTEKLGIFHLCLVFAVLFLLLILVCAQPLSRYSDAVDTPGERAKTHAENRDPAAQALRMPRFWFLFIWLVLVGASGLLTINNAGNIFAHYHAPAAAGMLSILVAGFGSQLLGIAIDCFGLRKAMLYASLFFIVVSTFLLAGHFSGSQSAVLLGVLLNGLVYGSTSSVRIVGALNLCGGKNFTQYFGVLNSHMIPSAILGPYVSGLLQTLGLGYMPSFVWLVVLAFATLAVISLGRKALPEKTHR